MHIVNRNNTLPPHLRGALQSSPPDPTPIKRVARSKDPRMFIWPVMDKSSYALTMDRYRDHIAAFNDQVPTLNRGIDTYNNAASAFAKANPAGEKQALIDLFNERYGKYKLLEYNEKVDSFNATHGQYLQKRRYTKVKPASELVFGGILFNYARNLKVFTDTFKSIDKRSKTTIPKCEVHAHNIAHQMRNGNRSLSFTPKTIRNHRDRLEEAGVIELRAFHGTSRPVDYFISSSILVVLEGFNPKNQNAENQTTYDLYRKKVPDTNVFTRAQSKISTKKKGNVHFLDAERPSDYPANTNNKNTVNKSTVQLQDASEQLCAKNAPGAANFSEASPVVSTEKDASSNASPVEETVQGYPTHESSDTREHAATFLNDLRNRFELAQELTQRLHDDYVRIPLKKLWELQSTRHQLTDREYKEIIVQDFIKSSAFLWKGNTPFPGSWYNAITFIYQSPGITSFTGNAMSKEDLFLWIQGMRYRLNYAIKWFKKRKWKGVSYPSIYFDPIRNNPNQICFAYTEKVWSKKQKQQSEKRSLRDESERKQRIADAKLKEDRKQLRKLDTAIRKYINKAYTDTQFWKYCNTQLTYEAPFIYARYLDKVHK